MSSKLKEIHVHEDFNDQQNMFAEKFSKSRKRANIIERQFK